jgi:hypothetical protein
MASLRTYCERLAHTVAQNMKENHFRCETSVGFLSNCCDDHAPEEFAIDRSFSGAGWSGATLNYKTLRESYSLACVRSPESASNIVERVA